MEENKDTFEEDDFLSMVNYLKMRANPEEDEDLTNYDIKFFEKLIANDASIFDIRSWKNGINKDEFLKLWNSGFQVKPLCCDKNGWNSGRFAYAAKKAIERATIDPEEVWRIMEKYRERRLKSFVESWKNSAEWEIKIAKECLEGDNIDIDIAKHWYKCALESWRIRNRCLKELGLLKEEFPLKNFGLDAII